MAKAMKRAGSTALRDMRSEARKRVRHRKRIKAKAVSRALNIARPKRLVPGVTSEWALNVTGKPMRVSGYPHRQNRKGVTARINRGKPSLLRSAFVATMRSGYTGVFERIPGTKMDSNEKKEKIREPLASRPVDALLHKGEAEGVGRRGARAFQATFLRNFPDGRKLLPALRERVD